ncbi:MAG: hypothetical protein DMG97_06450, partial [Acidobacteria bacterium]
HTYTYDAENRLIKVDGGATARYTYDPLGRRAQKTIGGTTTSYTYDLDGNTFLETQASNWETFYLYFAGRLQAQYKNNLTSFIHQDHLGSTHLVTAMNQSVYDNLDYLPFGEQIAGSSVTTHKFTGYESDSESSLDYASARHFSSTLGRFMQPDPLSGSIGNPQSWNRYAYVYNNPLNTTDPSGMCPPDSEDTSDCPGVGDLSQWDLANWNYEAILGMGGGWNSTDVYNYSDVFANPFAQPWWTNPAAANFPQGGFFDLLWGALGGFANSFGASLSNCGACSPQFQAFVNQQIQPRSNAEEIGMKVGPLVGLFIPGMGEQDAVEEEVVPIFRAVDQRELAFIKEFETYGSSASKSGKYFALTQEGAENFANSQFNAGRNMTITSTAVPRSVFNKGYFFSDPGGGGRSVHFSQDFLPTLYKSMIKIKIHP